MDNDIEYIEPTQEHVGQMVEVRDHNNQSWKKAKFYGLIGHDHKFIADYIGGVPISWKFARIPRPLTYAERQAKCGLKVGDRVRILTLPESGQDGWKAEAFKPMRHSVGCVYEITRDCKQYGFTVGGWNFPYFALEKVEDRQATIDDVGREVYIVPDYGNTFTFEAFYGVPGNPWRAVVRSGDKRFVYELSNLRVKE